MKKISLKKLQHKTAARKLAVVGWLCLGLLLGVALFFAGKNVSPVKALQVGEAGLSSPIPTLAYYYIWYDVKSWDRAKIDYPLLGHYSSDDRGVMHEQIRLAKAAGIRGFIVSWKSTDALNRRLGHLINLAEQEDFKLVIIYQGLDFDRNPLPVERIDTDLTLFTQRFAGRKPFDLFNKPVVIWSGTWKFSPEEIARVSANHRGDLLLLASEKNLKGYERLAKLVDGNAYYWSSVNPETYPDYPAKLVAMAAAVHKNGGLWIPPAAPGFDARLVGGTTIVDRKDGDTFRQQISTALASSPDALGIISWNEYSENSQIEPSVTFGKKYLDILSEVNHLPLPVIGEFDSSEAPITAPAVASPYGGIIPEGLLNSRKLAFGVLATLVISALVLIIRRRH
ncbi:MAG TPA: hypothetical protein VGK00_11225 [Anaerolineales bacterium]|jgi:hypothetical protein